MVVKMTIKQLIPKMLLVTGLVLTILVSAPSRVISTDPVKSKVQQEQHTEAVYGNKGPGDIIGTKTTTVQGLTTTVTTTYTAGEFAGKTETMKFGGSSGTLQSSTVKRPDGSNENSIYDDKGGKIVTTTGADGTVRLEKFTKGVVGGAAAQSMSSRLRLYKPLTRTAQS